MDKQLKFREDGTFKILQFTDIHLGNGIDGAEKDEKSIALMEKLIKEEQPDFIIHTGDQNWSHGVEDPIRGFRLAISPAVKSGIPFACVFGNHDAEENVTREQLMDVMLENETCFAEHGPKDITGVGNYVLTIKGTRDEQEQAILYFLDSGQDAPEAIGGYEWIHADQVAWYVTESRKMTMKHGAPLPSLAFFHIPLPEYETVLTKGRVYGHKMEQVCCPRINSGLFTAMIDMGDVMGTFVGHDHDNDFVGLLNGIRLCCGRVTGYNTYGNLQRGARVIQLQEGVRDFTTWLRLEDGKVIQ